MRRFLKEKAGAMILLREAAGKPACRFDRDYAHPSFEMLLPELQELRTRRGCSPRRPVQGGRWRRPRGLAIAGPCCLGGTRLRRPASGFDAGCGGDRRPGGRRRWNRSCDRAPSRRADLAASIRQPVVPAGVGPHCAWRTLQSSGHVRRGHRRASLATLGSGPSTPGRGDCSFPGCFIACSSWKRTSRRTGGLRPGGATWPPSRIQVEVRLGWRGRENNDIPEPTGLLTRLLAPAIRACRQAAARGEAERSLMRLALAAYRFQAKHGRLPASLDELVPDWIPVLPLDPSTASRYG